MKINKYVFILLLVNSTYFSQNLILNSSFSDVSVKKAINYPYRILNENTSEVKNWYIPSYIKPFRNFILVNYYSSRDKQLKIANRDFTNIDQLFEENLGFIELKLDRVLASSLIQQKISPIKAGKYCFKFKYKQKLPWRLPIEFSFSQTNLKEYAPRGTLKTPNNLIQICFYDSVTAHDDNLPWIQKSFLINLTGNEKYLSIGNLSNKTIIDPLNNKTTLTMCTYYIDDVELILIKDSNECECQLINKELANLYSWQFPINETIKSDTLIMYRPINSFSSINQMITPPAKFYLNNIIAFMQRNTTIKIKLIEYSSSNNPNKKLTNYQAYYNYINFFNINKNRISIEKGLCIDPKGIYCNFGSEYVQIGFEFYYE